MRLSTHAGARTVEVDAAAGSLRVEGKPGLRQVQVTGTARASSQQFLNQIKLIAERRGDVVFIKADIPDHRVAQQITATTRRRSIS